MTDRIEVKAALSVTDEGEITGIAWPFGSADRVGDVIQKGAMSSPCNLPMLFAHDQAQVIGVWDHIEETDEGLHVKGRLLTEGVERAREVRAMIQSKAVSGLSIGFVTKGAKRHAKGRTITAAQLHEISVVAVPCHPGAQITSIKSDDTTMPPQETNNMENEDLIDDQNHDPQTPANARQIDTKAFDEIKALTVANDTNGGYLAPEETGNELIKLLNEYSPIRKYTKVVNISAESINYPRRVTGTAATWVTETGNRTATGMTFEQVKMTPHELATFTDVSYQLLEDNAYGLEGELLSDFAESFSKTEDLTFVKGTGAGQPMGIMAAADIAEIKTGVAANFPASSPADGIIAMYHKIATSYAQSGVWMMNRNTLSVIRQWKDGNGRYLAIDPISEGAPTTLLGRPVVEMPDMDDIGAGNCPILFGDMSGYRIVDRIGLNTLRDPFSLAVNGQVRFHARKRVGADLTRPDRFIKLRLAA